MFITMDGQPPPPGTGKDVPLLIELSNQRRIVADMENDMAELANRLQNQKRGYERQLDQAIDQKRSVEHKLHEAMNDQDQMQEKLRMMSHRQQQSRKSGYGDADDDDDSTRAPRSGMSVPRIDKFDGNNWEGFASQFNSLADYYNWNSKERLLQLLHHVRDEARQFVYTKCDDSVRESYPKLEKALKQRFGANENKASFLYQLENIKFGPRDSLIEYCTDIAFLVRKAWPNMDEDTRADMEVEYFIKNLGDPGMVRTVGNKNPQDLDEARQFVEKYTQLEEAMKPRRGVRQVSFGADDHATPYVSENRLKEFGANLQGNIIKEIEVRFEKLNDAFKSSTSPTWSKQRPPNNNIVCYNCNRQGHISRQCNQPRKGQQYGGQQQHWQQQGPQSRLHQQGPPQFWNPPPQQQQRQGNLQNDGGNSGPSANAADTDQHHATATNQGN